MNDRRTKSSTKVLFLLFLCFASSAFGQGTWTSETPIPTPRFGAATGVINGQLYVAGGCCVTFGFPFTRFHTLEVYDPTTNSWTTKAPMPHAVYGAAAGVINGKLYAAGGQADPTDGNLVPDLQIYDPATDTWTTGAPLPQPTAAANGGVINGKLYVVSGGVNGNSAVSTVLVYDPIANTWTTLSPTPNPRSFAGTAVINGILYVVGGLIPSGQFSSAAVGTVDSYNPVTDTWTTLAPMPTPRFTVAIGVINGILYAAGGQDNFNTFAVVESYDPAKNTWSTAPSMLTPAYGPAAGVIKNTFILAGGNTVQFQLVNVVQAFRTCQVNLQPLAGPPFSLDGKPTSMNTAFTPQDTNGNLIGLQSAAIACGFKGFNWQQQITFWPTPSSLFPFTPSAVDPANITADGSLQAPPSFFDPPDGGGYRYEKGLDDAFPFYWNSRDFLGFVPCTQDIAAETFSTLNFQDCPNDPLLPPGSAVKFKTSLVGVLPCPPLARNCSSGIASAPLFTWTWASSFRGKNRAGGVSQSKSLFPLDTTSGTGGVTITSINDVPQIPPSVSCNATPNVLWPPNGKFVSVTVSGSITAGTSPILPNNVSFSVIDSEGQIQPTGPVTLGSDGSYSFAISLPASRDGNDKNGRQYTIGVIAADAIGNQGSCVSIATVPHDQGN